MELLADRIAAKLAPRELPELLTSADLAGLLSVDRKTVSRWRQDGLLPPALHVGRTLRWKRADVARWLDGLEVG